MGLDELRKEIRGQTAKEASHIKAEGRKEADAIIAEARKQAEKLLADAEHKASSEAEAREAQVSAARLEAKRIQAEATGAVTQHVLSELREELERMPAAAKKYKPLLKALIQEGIRETGKDAVVLVRKRDLPLAKELGYKAEACECTGGAIITTPDGRIRINNSFEAILEENDELLRQKIFEELFAGK